MNRLAAALLLVIALCTPSDAAIVQLMLDGDPGEFISQGQTLDLTYDDSQGSMIFEFLQQPIAGQPSDIRLVLRNALNTMGNTESILQFRTTQLGTPLTLGTFNNAMRPPEPAGFPGLSVSFSGRGANTSVNGSFTITQLQYDGMGNLERFNATFSHFADANPNELRGSISYSSAVPEPGTLGVVALCGLVVLGRRCFRRFRQRSKT